MKRATKVKSLAILKEEKRDILEKKLTWLIIDQYSFFW